MVSRLYVIVCNVIRGKKSETISHETNIPLNTALQIVEVADTVPIGAISRRLTSQVGTLFLGLE